MLNIKPTSGLVSTILAECQEIAVTRPAPPISLDAPLMSVIAFNLSLLTFAFFTIFQRLQEVNNHTYYITHRVRKWGKENT